MKPFKQVVVKEKPLQSDTKVGYPSKGGFQEIFRGFEKTNPNIILIARLLVLIQIKRSLKSYRWN